MDGHDEQAVAALEAAFRGHADPAEAVGMARYMRDQFPFLGIKSPARRLLEREALAGVGKPSEDDLRDVALRLWELPEREFQYAACGLLAKNVRALGPGSLALCRELITAKSWWDTVDSLAGSVVGGIVLPDAASVPVMDAWLHDDDLWLRRTAILHQLKYKDRTDAERLFRYCLARAGETEFFIRKAIGWALRQYSWTNPEAVQAFVTANEERLSGLSKREALLAINGGRKGTGQGRVIDRRT